MRRLLLPHLTFPLFNALCGVVFGALIGYFILKEPFGPRRLAATAMVLAGIGVLQLARAVS